jgi:hypothetical protein
MAVMPRTARVAPGGMVFHVLNRGVGRMGLLLKDAECAAFERVIEKAPWATAVLCSAPDRASRRRGASTPGSPGWNALGVRLWPRRRCRLGFSRRPSVEPVARSGDRPQRRARGVTS